MLVFLVALFPLFVFLLYAAGLLFKCATGLQYPDAFAENPVYNKAVSRLPADAIQRRQRRFKRALDLNQKHVELPEHMQVDPFIEYPMYADILGETQRLEDERNQLNDTFW